MGSARDRNLSGEEDEQWRDGVCHCHWDFDCWCCGRRGRRGWWLAFGSEVEDSSLGGMDVDVGVGVGVSVDASASAS
jgi:hypothetical protein